MSAWGVSASDTVTESEAVTESLNEVNGWTQSFRTIYEEAPGGVHTLEEQRYKKVAWLKKQPRQIALLVRPDFSLTPFRVATVRPPEATKASVETFITQRYQALPYVLQEQSMLEQLEARTRDLEQRAGIVDAGLNVTREAEFDPFDND